MTSREDLLDQYINARNRGTDGDIDLAEDSELRALFETVDQIKREGEIRYPESDFPERLASNVQQELSREPDIVPQSSDTSGGDVNRDQAFPAGSEAPEEEMEPATGWRWVVRQLVGIAAVGTVVVLFILALVVILGSWGENVQSPGAFVESGQIPGVILYAEYDGDQTLYRINADGTRQQELLSRASLRAGTPGFAWSPDGDLIAWLEPEQAEQWAPAVVTITQADGSGTTSLDMPSVSGSLRLDARLGWSYDGSSLAFVHQDQDTEQTRIGIVHRQTGELQTLQPGEGSLTANDSGPAWSPIRWALAFSRGDESGKRGIYVLYEGMDEPVPVVESDRRAAEPFWSPDGTRIVYVGAAADGEYGNIHIVDTVSGESANLSNHNRSDHFPVWSTRNQIAFLSDRGDMAYDIFLIDPAGEELQNITADYDWNVNQPDWSDDGRYLTFTSVNEDEDRWRINVYDVETDNLYTVLERENPLNFAQWRPSAPVIDLPDQADEPDPENGELTGEQLDLLRRSAEQYLVDDTDPIVFTVNGEPVTAAGIDSNQAAVQLNRQTMQEFLDESDADDTFSELATKYNEAFIAVIDEYGPENAGLGMALMQAAVWAYAEEHGLVATDEQVEETLMELRRSFESLREQDPEAMGAVGDATVEIIGEARYWDEYMPRALERSLTEANVNEAIWADIAPSDPDQAIMNRDLLLAEFRADLLREADIEIVDENRPSGADLDRAIEYITEAYPALQKEHLERQEGMGVP